MFGASGSLQLLPLRPGTAKKEPRHEGGEGGDGGLGGSTHQHHHHHHPANKRRQDTALPAPVERVEAFQKGLLLILDLESH